MDAKRIASAWMDNAERRRLRSCLHEAGRNRDRLAFMHFVEGNLDLLTEVLGVGGVAHPADTVRQSLDFFCRLWSVVPLVRRVSDFERLAFLEAQGLQTTLVYEPNPILEPIAALSAVQRFIVVAGEMEAWPLHRIARACRLDRERLLDEAMGARCRICRFDTSHLKGADLDLLRQVNASLSGALERRRTRILMEALARSPEIAEFHALWLEHRSQVIELRETLRLHGYERRKCLYAFCDQLDKLPNPRRTSMRERMRLFVDFSSWPAGSEPAAVDRDVSDSDL